MPSLVNIVRVMKDDQALDLGAGQKAANCYTTLPAEDAEPADKEREALLVFSGTKLGNPVILPAY